MKFKKCIASLLITVSLSSVFFSSAVSVKVLADDVKSPQVVDYNNQEQKQIDDVANIFKQMFENGITEKNFSEYVYNNFSRKDISDVENELEASINDPYERVPWNQMGKCMVGKIRDEFFATINVAVIVRYAQKKAWEKLASVIIRFAKASGLRTNIYIIAGQLAVWAIQCGVE